MQIDREAVKKIYITASGGPFYKMDDDERQKQTCMQAIKHPKWSMGAKISVDSATLINKCFELIEAHHWFPNCEIEALYHPQANVHSLVEFKNGAVFANLSTPDMRLPIDLALNGFQKRERKIPRMNFEMLDLHFETINSQV